MLRPSIVFSALLLAFSAVPVPSHAADRNGGVWIRGVFAGRSPAPVAVPAVDVWRRAHAASAAIPGSFALAGTGDSMSPLYANGTVLVCRSLSYAELARGMTVLYRNSERRIVAHVLVAKTRDGWRATGLNNNVHDMEPIVADNLVGVVVAAFAPAGIVTSTASP